MEVCTIWPYAVNFIRLQRRKVATAPDGSPGVSTPVVVVPDPGGRRWPCSELMTFNDPPSRQFDLAIPSQ